MMPRRRGGSATGTALQPVVRAAVDLDEHARARHALASAPVATGSTAFGAADAGVVQDPPQRGVGDVQALPLGEEFLEVEMVGPRVGSRGEPDHALAQRASQPPRRSAATVAMNQGRRAAGPLGGTQTTDLAGGAAEQPRGPRPPELRPPQGGWGREL